MIEYIIWGIAPGEKQEDLLLDKLHGKPVTSRLVAGKAMQTLIEMGCTATRIQEIDLSKAPDFIGALNL